jgi:hypothetical protein
MQSPRHPAGRESRRREWRPKPARKGRSRTGQAPDLDRGAATFPAIGHEPFNPSPADLESAWEPK